MSSLNSSITASFGYRMLNEGLVYEDLTSNYEGFVTAHIEGSSRGVGLGINLAVIDYSSK